MVKLIGDRFVIEDENNSILGVGGMGTVYRGVDKLTQDFVAIKELKRDVLDMNPDMLERFEREAEALRVLNHPNIVKVLSLIQETDHHYIVMEYVSGGSLRDLLEEIVQLPIERVLEIGLDIADALTRAHRLKIIHRDIKPANVMLAEDGTPRLTDFGVARIDQKTRMTETGMVVGTLSYLSPEALDGSRPDERQDIWAFGILLYEMLTGTRPFDGETASAVITSILTKPMPDPLTMRPDIPVGLIRLIESTLRKDPNERISSVRRVGTEIENIIRGVDSDEYEMQSGVIQSIKENDESRFEVDSDEMTPPVTPLSSVSPATKYGIPEMSGVRVLQDESGEDMLVLPVGIARKGRKIFATMTVLLVLVVGALLFVLGRRPNMPSAVTDTPNGQNVIIPGDMQSIQDIASQIEPVADDEFMLLIIPAVDIEANDPLRDPIEHIIVDMLDTFERDIPFSNIRTRLIPSQSMTLPQAQMLFEMSQADIMVLLEIEDDQIDALIQGGNPHTMDVSLFGDEADVVRRAMSVEVVIEDTEEQSVTPYILGTMSLVHAIEGNVFEFMRTLAILDEITLSPATLLSGGVGQYFFNYYNIFLDDTEGAIEAINPAIELDGGNPLWYVLRAVAYMRLNDSAQAVRDARTAQRLAPQGWPLPLVIEASMSDVYGEGKALLDDALTNRNDWFLLYLQSTFNYASNDLDGAWESIQQSLQNNPQANYPYVTGFLIAMRTGHINDAGRLMSQMVREQPNPTLGNRVYRAMFGDNNIEIILSGMLYEGFGNIVLGQYEPVTAYAPRLQQLMRDFGSIMLSFDTTNENDTQRYFAGDVFSMMGLAFCALEDYEVGHNWLTQGITIDSTSLLARYIRTETSTQLGLEDLVAEDVAVMQGVTEEFDRLIQAGQSQEISCSNFFDYFVEAGQSN